MMNKNKKLMVAALIGFSLYQPTYAADQTPQVEANIPTEQTSSGSQKQSKFEVDYMENGVHVIIPKILPNNVIKDGQSVMYDYYYAKELSAQMQSVYKDAGYTVKGVNSFRSGVFYHQFPVFTGNKAQLVKFNELGAEAAGNKSMFMRGVATLFGVTAAVVGTKFGGLNIGATAGDLALKNVSTNQQQYVTEFALFEGYENIEAKETDIIQVFAVTTGSNSTLKKGRVIFVSENGVFDMDLISKAIMRAQNFTKN